MSIKNIRKQLKDAKIKGTVRYLGNEIRAKGYGINKSTCMYEISFPKIKGEEYWDEPIEVIDESDASCKIEDYLYDQNTLRNWTTLRTTFASVMTNPGNSIHLSSKT